MDFLSHMSFVDIFNVSVLIAFTICYAYQLFYVPVSLIKRPKKKKAAKQHKYAAVIAARNEEAVIGDLISSIRMQDYPAELIDIFIIADNCTDSTASIARKAGAFVIERHDDSGRIGKGWALDYGIDVIRRDYKSNGYEAYFVFDADNVLDAHYFSAMNDTFDSGAIASTSYRNSKNFSMNWISAGYGVWFLREAKFLSQSRSLLNTSCAISGTGFYVSEKIIARNGGWKWHLLTEDIEFSADAILNGERIAYTPDAILYDEQPVTFKASWNQRYRWAKGFYQVFGRYGLKLAKGIFTNKRGARFACFDMLMTIAPGLLLTIIAIIFNATIAILGAFGVMSTGQMVMSSLSSICFCLVNYLGFMGVFGVLTTFVEWDSIHASTKKKVFYMFTFPFFMLTYIPIAIAALFGKANWKPIEHKISVDATEFIELASNNDTTDKKKSTESNKNAFAA